MLRVKIYKEDIFHPNKYILIDTIEYPIDKKNPEINLIVNENEIEILDKRSI